jgi:DNA-binding CsgD family transcriptional regulator
VFCSTPLFAISNPDGILAVATNTEQSIQNRIRAYSKLVYHFETIDTDKAIQYGNDGLALPQVDSLNQDIADLYVNIAFVYVSSQEYSYAIKNLLKAAGIYKLLGDKKSEAIQYKNIGVMFRKLGNYTDALNYQLLGLDLYKSIGDVKGQTKGLMNIGNIYIFQEQPRQGLPYFEKAYQLALTQTDSHLITQATNSYALVYEKIGELDTAIVYYLQAIEGYKKFKDWESKAKAEHNLATIYLNRKNYELSEKMLVSSLNIFEHAPQRFTIEIATITFNLGKIYFLTERNEMAIENFESVLATFGDKGARTEEKTTLLYLSQALVKQDDFELAYKYQTEYLALKDSIQSEEITKSIVEITEKYESEKKEKEILELQNKANLQAKSRWVIISISIGIIGLLLILFLIYRQRIIKEAEKTKTRLQQYAKEMDLLRQKIESDTTQYMLPEEVSFTREDVNAMLTEELSDRELDVFMLLLEGHNNKTIGEKLFVSVNTIKYHLQNIYHKLDVSNRSDAIKSVSNKEPLSQVS